MNSTVRLIKEMLCRQLFKKHLRTVQGWALTPDKLLRPGLCLLLRLHLEKNRVSYITCSILENNGRVEYIRVLRPRRLLTPALETYICSLGLKHHIYFELYPHLGISHGEVLLL